MLPPALTPDLLRQLELLRIKGRRAFLGLRQGAHLSLKRGHGIEFSDYRQYELGDNPRHIDWGVYARSDKLYVKRFQEEQNLTVLIIIDATFSMFTPPGDRKWEMGRDIGAALAYIALMAQDTVTIAVPGHFQSPSFYGVRAVHQIGASLLEVRAREIDNFSREVQRAVTRVKFPGVAIFISDFLMPFQDIQLIFNAMRAKNLDAHAVQVLGPTDINLAEGTDSVIAIDSETGEEVELGLDAETRDEYGLRLMEHNTKIREFLSENHIPYSLAISNQSLSDFLVSNLSASGLLQ